MADYLLAVEIVNVLGEALDQCESQAQGRATGDALMRSMGVDL